MVAARLLGRDRDNASFDRWRRDGFPTFDHALNMKLNGFTDLFFDFLSRFPRSDASRKVRNVGRPIPFAPLIKNGILFHGSSSNPACFRTLFKVFGCTSSDSCPETVTVPGLIG